MARGVGGQADGFADCTEAAASPARREGVLEGQFRLVVNQAAGHHQVAGNPLGALRLKGLDLVLRGAVQLLARDILIDFG